MTNSQRSVYDSVSFLFRSRSTTRTAFPRRSNEIISFAWDDMRSPSFTISDQPEQHDERGQERFERVIQDRAQVRVHRYPSLPLPDNHRYFRHLEFPQPQHDDDLRIREIHGVFLRQGRENLPAHRLESRRPVADSHAAQAPGNDRKQADAAPAKEGDPVPPGIVRQSRDDDEF